MIGGERGSVMEPLESMEDQAVFVELLFGLTSSLESMGIYPIDVSSVLTGETHSSYEDLRSKILNLKTELRFDIVCLFGDSAWSHEQEEDFDVDIEVNDFLEVYGEILYGKKEADPFDD